MDPVPRSRGCRVCGQPTANANDEITSITASPHGSCLCPDCLVAVYLAAEAPDDDCHEGAPTLDGAPTLETVDEAVTSIYLTLSPDEKLEETFCQSLTDGMQRHSVIKLQVKRLRSYPSRIHCELVDVQRHPSQKEEEPGRKRLQVTPDLNRGGATQRAAASRSGTCADCHEPTEPDESMTYCKLCYAKRCQIERGQVVGHGVESSSTRTCGTPLLSQAAPGSASTPPLVCTDCGGPIDDDLCAWTTKCRPCLAVKRPRLLPHPKPGGL
jgi:hypothetical protein